MNTFLILSALTAALVATCVAVFVLWQAPRHRPSRTFALGWSVIIATELFCFLAATAASFPRQLFWMRTALLAEGLWPACWFLFSLDYARAGAPTRSMRSKGAMAAMVLLPLAIGLLNWSALLALPLDSYEPGRYFMLGPWGRLLIGLTLAALVLPLINLEATLRASTGLGRWHVKFMILGVGLLLGFEIYLQSYRLLFATLDRLMIGPQAVVIILAAGLMTVSLIRNRRGAIELSVSQSAVFGSIVLLLIGGYLVAVGVLAQLWALVNHDTAELWRGLLFLLALIGLISLILSARLKARVRQWLSRHLYPHRYDYRLEWLQLTERTSRQFGLDASLRAVVDRLAELFNAPRVSAWLFDETNQQLRLAATVQVTSTEETTWRAQPIVAPALAADLLSWNSPRVVTTVPANATDPIAAELETFVRQTRAHVAAPLVLGGRALGLLAVGDQLAGQPYGSEELLLIGAIAQQSAASVLTARLAQEVMRTREAELSQLYATFLVHDLKNLGTTLSLVTQNLPLRYDDARFRDDAQRVISETIDKIKEMTERVTTLRQDYELVLEATDLNRLAEESLRSLNGSTAAAVAFEPTTLPPVRLDRRQFRSVLTNLLLNAQEASRHANGRIRLRTEHRNGWAALSVIDDGCGMSADFMDRHLFQPFRSTKPGGLGIGLYQCRKIVDAHGGRMTVDSQEGKGTTVTIVLPAPTE